ncbi:MAG: GNAT family N-acetyltransferase [Rhodanobacter sp.]|nr:MAG: GNAT family N-acetyltransferase [Rhodanobacter sp.]TAM15172.1 MAG: GNAT family N-acetyltransferase [Rhodanobacter sp.]TAM36358.1 MAG: GNAT family N-acetyltransferase [Rhodanobacter sp.]
MHPLDRPAWASLVSFHQPLSLGAAQARRYARDVNVFAATGAESEDALAALAALVASGEQVYVLQAPPIRVPPELVALRQALCVQMLAANPVADAADTTDMVPLGAADAAEMLALAELTEPGPFRLGTWRMGQFFGIRIGGRLAAMAGERFHCPGFAEVSGVCTHPDFRGRGLASRLSRHVAARIAARGETAFLHAWQDHADAIHLYQRLGFAWRCDVNVAVLARR